MRVFDAMSAHGTKRTSRQPDEGLLLTHSGHAQTVMFKPISVRLRDARTDTR